MFEFEIKVHFLPVEGRFSLYFGVPSCFCNEIQKLVQRKNGSEGIVIGKIINCYMAKAFMLCTNTPVERYHNCREPQRVWQPSGPEAISR